MYAKIVLTFQIGFDIFFEQMFSNTDISRFNSSSSGNDQMIHVLNTVYLKNLNDALNTKQYDFWPITLGNFQRSIYV